MGKDFGEEHLDPPLPQETCFGFDGNRKDARQHDPTAATTNSTCVQVTYGQAHGQLTEHGKRHTAMPPMLHVTSTVELNNGSSSGGMNQGPGSGKPEELLMPPNMETSLSSWQAEYSRCRCVPGCCTCKKPPSLSTVRRPGCRPRTGRHANAAASPSNGPLLDESTVAIMTSSTRSNCSAISATLS